MKRWTSTWTAMLVVGFLAVPGIGLAQTSPAAVPSATSSATAQDKSAQGTPQEHLQEADAALNSISPTAVSGKAKSQIADLKKHVNSLQKMTASTSADASANATSAAKWSTEAAAADKIFGELLSATPATGDAAASVTAEPKPTGTSGTAAPKASAAVGLDEETKSKLAAARASLTAFAAAMSGTAPAAAATASPAAAASPSTAASAEPSAAASTASPRPSSPEPSPASPATPAAQQPAATPAQQPATPSTPPAEPTPSTQPPATPSQQPATPPTEPTSPAQPPASTTQPPAEPTAKANVNPDAAKQALTAARDSLAQMTQLPAAQALTGEPRAQVSQLISNFNELITTSSEWKASYAKVDANLNALLGSQGPDESAAPAPAPATAPPSPTAPPSSTTPPTAGAAGAVGTSGTTTGSLDPAIKAKLVEFRTHLKEFEKAAGGSAAK